MVSGFTPAGFPAQSRLSWLKTYMRQIGYALAAGNDFIRPYRITIHEFVQYPEAVIMTAMCGFIEGCRDKKYGILVFLKNPVPVEPFHINKAGFGMAAAWIAVEDIHALKV
jgi:hypothetical protein